MRQLFKVDISIIADGENLTEKEIEFVLRNFLRKELFIEKGSSALVIARELPKEIEITK